MVDAFHYYGGDLQLDSSGDIQTVDSVQESQQRILRRLLTNPGDYWWHPEYGAGLPAWIGQDIDEVAMTTLIKTQMYLEESVVQNPPPQIEFSSFSNGLSSLISYVESDSNQAVTLSFSATQ
ncbi:MAG: hypothetical protein WAL34_04055 [Acidobacteriaceae bacterium]